ncbi:ribonuclease H-like domain-containing protein [Candidatus Fermentibacteria bacterium]|nr:ribonuclease H-like domain-containing protein [Candidatus Fermentibacteria bacterium]
MSDASETVEILRRLIARVEAGSVHPARRQRRVPIADVVAGSFLDTPHGPLFTTRAEVPLSWPRGRFGSSLSLLETPLPHAMTRLAGHTALAGMAPARLLFLDTETTGLATTAGTFAFLVGVGFVDGCLFVVEQFFARDFDEEPALLWALDRRLRNFQGLVTYNGRAFDLPLLAARFATNRVFDPPIPDLHLDMLYPARRLWRARGAGCSLSSLEREILGVEREGDVPGAMIPGIYFSALGSGDARGLAPVFEHNAHDILSLAGLTVEAARLLAGTVPTVSAAEDLLSLARIVEAEAARDALKLYRAAADGEFKTQAAREEALGRLGLLYRRLGERDEACRVFSSLAKEGRLLRPFSLVELAKELEHNARAFDEARVAAEEALRAIQELKSVGATSKAQFRVTANDVQQRIARLSARARGLPWRRQLARP